ncbi:disease resistance protein Roq1-like [Cornus florida]|uniref:disease resistance protein Roq1-like n=1 Tax=Cornus florida TaxID=4283 RepID=UPI00289B9361|nr:disease resistance protein Roq1-like [Cornus florida]
MCFILDRDEDKFIQLIVQEISRQLPPTPLSVAKYGVGIDSRANKVIMLLNERSEDNLFVRICETGGISKTTVAKAVFNQMSKEFERSCFLGNVREESTKQDGLAKLQQKLLRKTLMDNYLEISNSDQGMNEIKVILEHKKIRVVLNDVNHEKQLESLAGIRENWFGSGNKIIITTRDERLLRKFDIETYKVEILDDKEALELFNWHAFQQDNPVEIYRELSYRVKYYTKGLPLALQVLGSLLCKRSISEWKNELDKLKSNPPKGIQDVLKISYDFYSFTPNMSSSSSSRSHCYPYWRLVKEYYCKCGVKSPLKVSYTQRNPGRWFYGCANYRTGSCGFLRWEDDELPDYYRKLIIQHMIGL